MSHYRLASCAEIPQTLCLRTNLHRNELDISQPHHIFRKNQPVQADIIEITDEINLV